MRSRERVDKLVAHHDHRLELCLRAVVDGARTAYEVAGELPWTRRSTSLAELDFFNVAMATLETLFHLALLAERRLVSRSLVEGTAHFAPARPA